MSEAAYQLFFNADLTKLPTDVLKSIYATVRIEIDKRRQESATDSQQIQWAEGASKRVYCGLPRPHTEYNHHWLKYLESLLDQDWSHLFSGDSERKYYVYAHYSPNGKGIRFFSDKLVVKLSGLPFYIGKGTGDRAYDLKRNQGHGEMLKDLHRRGTKPDEMVEILKDKLTEAEALELESKLIYFFGTKYEKNRRGLLVNLDIPPRPEMLKPSTYRALT
jgi:hypothetical protein